MQANDGEYIAYRADKYTQIHGENPKLDDEDEFAYEKVLPNFKWNQFMNEYNSLASDISFKRVKRQDEAPPPAPPPEAGAGGAEGGGAGGGGEAAATEESIELFLTPVIGLTVFFAIVFVIGPYFVRKGPNRGIVQCSIMLSAFCMWIFWVTIYIGQMNPLIGPRLENTTIAWIAEKLGNPAGGKAPPPTGGDSGGGDAGGGGGDAGGGEGGGGDAGGGD